MAAGMTIFRAMLTVACVLALAYWCSRALGRTWGKGSGSGNMRVIESIQVGQDRRILLLKVGEHHYLVGTGQSGIRLLAEVEGDFQDMPPETADVEAPSFQALLNRYLTRHHEKGGVDK